MDVTVTVTTCHDLFNAPKAFGKSGEKGHCGECSAGYAMGFSVPTLIASPEVLGKELHFGLALQWDLAI